MSIDAQRVKATGAQAGRACLWCGLPLVAGEDTAICIACDAVHHTVCWRKYGGCGWSGCLNEPVTRKDADAGARRILPENRMYCPRCGGVIARDLATCPHCKSRTSAGGLPAVSRTVAPGGRVPGRFVVQEASTALISGLVGLVVLGFVFGPVAIVSGRNAIRRIHYNRRRGDLRYAGDGQARAGIFLGVAATILHTSLLVLYVLAALDPERFNPYLPYPIPPDLLDRIREYLFGSLQWTRRG